MDPGTASLYLTNHTRTCRLAECSIQQQRQRRAAVHPHTTAAAVSAAYVQYMASRRQVTSSTEHAAPSAAGRVAGAKKYEGCKCKRKAEACSTGRVALERQVCTCGVPGTARPMVSQATQAPHVQTEHAPLQSTINSLVVLSYYTLLIAHGHKTAPNNPGTYSYTCIYMYTSIPQRYY